MNHTKAPWGIFLKTDELTQEGIIIESCNEHDIRPSDGQSLGDELDDLKLISLAPEMYSVLKTVKRLLDGSQPKDIPGALMAINHVLGKLDNQ